MTQYIGILDGSGKVYGVRIPDLPGCYGAGRSPEAALADAMSAARDWLPHRATKGGGSQGPHHGANPQGRRNRSGCERGRRAGAPVVLDKGRTVRANLTIDDGLREAIDAEAEKRGVSRSAFVASLARERLETV